MFGKKHIPARTRFTQNEFITNPIKKNAASILFNRMPGNKFSETKYKEKAGVMMLTFAFRKLQNTQLYRAQRSGINNTTLVADLIHRLGQ